MALSRYYTVFEKEKVNCTTKVWAADEYCGEVTFKDIALDSTQINIPFTHFFKPAPPRPGPGAGSEIEDDGLLLLLD